jgi:hypothetical protein
VETGGFSKDDPEVIERRRIVSGKTADREASRTGPNRMRRNPSRAELEGEHHIPLHLLDGGPSLPLFKLFPYKPLAALAPPDARLLHNEARLPDVVRIIDAEFVELTDPDLGAFHIRAWRELRAWRRKKRYTEIRRTSKAGELRISR